MVLHNKAVRSPEALESRNMLSGDGVEVPAYVVSEVAILPVSNNASTTGEVADLNGDSIPDLVLIRSSKLEVMLGDGEGQFTKGPGFITSKPVTHLAFGDMNGDGIIDWLARGQDSFGGQDYAARFLSQSNGGWQQSPLDFSVEVPLMELVELNGDETLDLVLFHVDGAVEVRFGDGQGNFLEQAVYPSMPSAEFYFPGGGAFGDVNGDGHVDIARLNADATEILFNDGRGVFDSATDTGRLGQPAVLSDLDGDGKLDLLTSTRQTANSGVGFLDSTTLQFAVHLGNGEGEFGDVIDLLATEYGSDARLDAKRWSIGDLNGDGLPDLVVQEHYDIHFNLSPSPRVFLGRGDGSFLQSFRTGAQDWSSRWFAVVDTNQDGQDEILTVSSIYDGMRWTTTLAVSTLGKHGPFAPFATNFESEEGDPKLYEDLNGDDFIDLLTTFGSTGVNSPHQTRILAFTGVPWTTAIVGVLEPARMLFANVFDPQLRVGETISSMERDFDSGLLVGISVTIALPTGETRTEYFSLDLILGATDNSPKETDGVVATWIEATDVNSRITDTDEDTPKTTVVPLGFITGVNGIEFDSAMFDLDGDGDLDLLQHHRKGEVVLWAVGDGDVNDDESIDARDVQAIRDYVETNAEQRGPFDLNGDRVVNQLDVTHLVENIVESRLGDSNLDGRVDFIDFLALANNFGSQDAVWDDGDFDGDGMVGFDDFLLLAENFGFER